MKTAHYRTLRHSGNTLIVTVITMVIVGVFIDLAMLVVQLVAAEHTPKSA